MSLLSEWCDVETEIRIMEVEMWAVYFFFDIEDWLERVKAASIEYVITMSLVDIK